MKRFISAALALMLALSFTACGMQTDPYGKKYEKLITLMENGDFAAASHELDRLAGQYTEGYRLTTFSYYPDTMNKQGTKYTMAVRRFETLGVARMQGKLAIARS